MRFVRTLPTRRKNSNGISVATRAGGDACIISGFSLTGMRTRWEPPCYRILCQYSWDKVEVRDQRLCHLRGYRYVDSVDSLSSTGLQKNFNQNNQKMLGGAAALMAGNRAE